jgi:hypothetical protein
MSRVNDKQIVGGIDQQILLDLEGDVVGDVVVVVAAFGDANANDDDTAVVADDVRDGVDESDVGSVLTGDMNGFLVAFSSTAPFGDALAKKPCRVA